jgi:lysophospholipase
VLLHGRTEFIEKYDEVMGLLCQRGFQVVTMDWRGQGLSTRPLGDRHKGHIDDFTTYVRDLSLFVDEVARPASRGPLYLVSHSMGGNIVLHYLRSRPGVFRRVFLTSPMVAIRLGPASAAVKALVRLAARLGRETAYVPGTGPYQGGGHRFDGNDLTSDPARFERIHALIAQAPDLALGGPTLGWLSQAMRASDCLFEAGYAEGITTPTTFVVAGSDSVVDNDKTAALARRMVSAEVLCVGGSQHELLNERDVFTEQFWAAFDVQAG